MSDISTADAPVIERDLHSEQLLNFELPDGDISMSGQYALPDVLEKMYENQLALEAALMEMTLWIEQRGAVDPGNNMRGALQTIGQNAGFIRQGLARLRKTTGD